MRHVRVTIPYTTLLVDAAEHAVQHPTATVQCQSLRQEMAPSDKTEGHFIQTTRLQVNEIATVMPERI